MAQYFTQLEKQDAPFDNTQSVWRVIQVVAVGDDIATADGPLKDNPMHADGEAWCVNWFKGGTWKQTFQNGLRKKYAGVGNVYDYSKDKFMEQQPFASWSLDDNDDWQAPVPYPTIDTYTDNGNERPYGVWWDEEEQMWKGVDHQTPQNTYEWNPETLAWGPPTP